MNRQNKPAYNPQAIKRVEDFFGKFNKKPFRTLGEELAESGPDAVIVAIGAQRALSAKASETPERAAQ